MNVLCECGADEAVYSARLNASWCARCLALIVDGWEPDEDGPLHPHAPSMQAEHRNGDEPDEVPAAPRCGSST